MTKNRFQQDFWRSHYNYFFVKTPSDYAQDISIWQQGSTVLREGRIAVLLPSYSEDQSYHKGFAV